MVTSLGWNPYNGTVNLSDATRAFVARHRAENVRNLALHAKHDDDVDLPLALDQIAGWQTACAKLPTWAAHDDIWYPPHLSMEQCSSEATARYKMNVARRLIGQASETSLVDLTGGFGVDCSYMARAFDHATYVERQEHLCALAEHNMAALGLEHVDVVNADAKQYLQSMPQATLIFLDPARRDAHGARTYAIADCAPDALGLKNTLLAKAEHVMIKLSPMLDWRKTVADFQGAVSEVHIVSAANECKELLLVLGRDVCDAPRLVCVNDDQCLEVAPNKAITSENAAHCDAAAIDMTSENIAGWHLYEPNASVMKAGCFAMLEQRFGVTQIAPNSHLFISHEAVANFPGREFVIDAASTMGKKELRATLAGLTHANITARNVPLSVAALRKKLKLKDGGDTTLFATSDSNNRHLIIRCHKPASAPQR
nr:class I SAM-dependent methyltransferase [Bifidobacterium sp. DSM 109957]